MTLRAIRDTALQTFSGGKRSVADILSGFNKMVGELNQIAAREEAEADRIQAEMAELSQRRTDALAEQARARSAAAKISALVA